MPEPSSKRQAQRKQREQTAKEQQRALLAQYAAQQSENRVEQILDAALDALHAYNQDLLQLRDQLATCQPKGEGWVALELWECGRGCLGCPHPRWVKHILITDKKGESRPVCINLSAEKRDPVLAVPRKAKYYTEAVRYIRTIKEVLDRRSKLLKAVSAVGEHLSRAKAGAA